MSVQDMKQNDMMAHLTDALDQHKDIGHYGRLVFAMVGQYFMSKDELAKYLAKNPGVSEEDAKALVLEVTSHGYNPPKRNKILAWQKQQDFPICPNPDDPNACDVYQDLRFPDQVYQNIEEYYEDQVEAQEK